MRKVKHTNDMGGRTLHKGDTVMTVSDSVTARVCDIALERDSTAFVCLRMMHQPYSHGIWHAADQVMWIANARN
jgi:hypothetical protein